MATRILFQGDSITDAERERERDAHLGVGYPNLVAGRLGLDYPGKYEFFNRGIGGNRSIDVLARVRCDILSLKPDVMSILMGINDVWHEIERGNGVSVKYYNVYYDLLIDQIKAELPDTRIIIMEPFVLKGYNTEANWERFREETAARAKAAREIAERHGLEFIPLMEKFNEADKLTEQGYWLKDGVHPTPAGHELIAREWVKTFFKGA